MNLFELGLACIVGLAVIFMIVFGLAGIRAMWAAFKQ